MVNTPYPERLLSKEGWRLTHENMSTVTFSSLLTNIDVHCPSFEFIPFKAVADGRLSLRQLDSALTTLMRDYERINHLSRCYSIYLTIDPDHRQIRQEWVDAVLLQHRLSLLGNTLMREDCERFLGRLARVDQVGYGYRFRALVTASLNKSYFEDELVCPEYAESVPEQGYRRTHPHGGFTVFSDALKLSVSPNDHKNVYQVCREIIWFKMLTPSQREMFQMLHDEMRAVFYIVHPEHAPPSYDPEHQQTPVENNEQLGAVGSPLSVSSQVNPAKRVADTDADADLRPVKRRRCLAGSEGDHRRCPFISSSDHGDGFGG
ncbi:hypothetical protein BZA70DRAFT_284715 [Myxozyma melibiosi]|uniref:Uncharacterized protein n=1 Tax=Myxozyma melibiosi TaxID=54550 RepID=A0ABR1EYP2_9ASCO